MNPTEQPSQPSTPPEWFSNIPASQPLPPAATPPNPRRTFIIISSLVTIILIACIVLGAILTYRALTACLTTADYRELAGKELQDTSGFSPKENFYTATLQYNNRTTTIANVDSNPDQARLITKIAEFYNLHSTSRPMRITVSGGYTTADNKDSAEKRIKYLSAALVEKGVKASAISSEEPTEIMTEGELTAESDELKTARTYVSLTSSSNCTE